MNGRDGGAECLQVEPVRSGTAHRRVERARGANRPPVFITRRTSPMQDDPACRRSRLESRRRTPRRLTEGFARLQCTMARSSHPPGEIAETLDVLGDVTRARLLGPVREVIRQRARTRGDVEHASARRQFQGPSRPPSPCPVDTEAQQRVERIVVRGDAIDRCLGRFWSFDSGHSEPLTAPSDSTPGTARNCSTTSW